QPSCSKSQNPLCTPAMMLPSPTLTTTTSGTSHPICSAISKATVFLPSVVNGLMPVLRQYQPSDWQMAKHRSNATSYEASTNSTVAPYISSCAILASGAVAGTKITIFMPTDAPMPASAAAALPVLAVLTISTFACIARATTNALALSLSDPVGFLPSSFTHTCWMPSDSPIRGAE